MSLETWKDEYYPVDAGEVRKDDALDHSLRKWTGLLPENLARHGAVLEDFGCGVRVTAEGGTDSFRMDGLTCALCATHECKECPLKVIGGEECDPDDCHAPTVYRTFHATLNPQPMIELMTRVKKELEK